MIRLRRARLFLALLSGLLLALAFPQFDQRWLAWCALASLLVALPGARSWEAFLCGWLHGAVFYVLALTWIYTVMRVHGGISAAPAAGVLALMVAVLALFPAAFSMGVAYLAGAGGSRTFWLAPFLWVALEFGRTHMPIIGFPWNLLGYTLVDQLVLMQLASFTGVYGLSFFVSASNALLAWMLIRWKGLGRRAVAFVAVLAVALFFAEWVGRRLVPTPEARFAARLVQTNLPQATSYPANWMETHAAELDEFEKLSIGGTPRGSGLLVWPEVPAPFLLADPKFVARAERIVHATGGYFLAGIVNWRPAQVPPSSSQPPAWEGPYNSVALFSPGGRVVFLYDKIHLVPFGEYVPLRRWLTFAGKLTAEVGDFQPGSVHAVGELPGGRFGAFICYEAIFPADVRRFVIRGAALLINMSNDGWFGHSAAPAQHLAMARVRAVENRRWLLRATNTGVTVSIDPYGRYRARLEPYRRAALDAPYDFRTDLTGYARWGDWVAWLCLAVSAYLLVSGRIRPSLHRRGTFPTRNRAG